MSVVSISVRSNWTEWPDHPFPPCCDARPKVFRIEEGGKKRRKTQTVHAECAICGLEVYALAIDFTQKWERYRKRSGFDSEG